MQKEKARVYRLTRSRTPLTFVLANKDSRSKSLQWYDKDARKGEGEQRALRYAPNQKSIFVDEQDGEYRLEAIVFRDGSLTVPGKEVRLQEFLAHHPDNVANGGAGFYLQDFAEEAKREIELMDIEDRARELAKSLSKKDQKNLVRKLKPSSVEQLEPSQIMLEVRLFAKRDPERFLEMADRSDVELEGTIAELFEAGLLVFTKGDKEVHFNLEDNKKPMFSVPKNRLPREAVSEFLMSNEGLKHLKMLERELEALQEG